MEKNYSAEATNNEQIINELIQLILLLLTKPKLPEDLDINELFLANPDFQKVYDCIVDTRELSAALKNGDLQKFVTSKGFILSNLKALQSNLRHLTWQTKSVAKGDFSQRVDFLGEFSDSFNEMIDQLRDSRTKFIELARLDRLTQIPNRMAIETFMDQSFAKAKKEGKHLCVLLFDVDHFKKVNDTYGHDVGDIVLKEISNILSKQFRSTDIFGRYGGEEFIAGLMDTDINTAITIAERSLKIIRETTIKIDDTNTISVTVSIGISEMKVTDLSYHDVIKRSDEAMYESKKSGRNRLSCIFN